MNKECNEIEKFVRSLEANELIGDEQSLLLSGESLFCGRGAIVNSKSCTGSNASSCVNQGNCKNSHNADSCSNMGNCSKSVNEKLQKLKPGTDECRAVE